MSLQFILVLIDVLTPGVTEQYLNVFRQQGNFAWFGIFQGFKMFRDIIFITTLINIVCLASLFYIEESFYTTIVLLHIIGISTGLNIMSWKRLYNFINKYLIN